MQFDRIIHAMETAHGINPAWGFCVPSVQSGAAQAEYHFLVGRNIETFTQAQVDAAVESAFPVSVEVAYAEAHFQMEPEPEEVVIPVQVEAEIVPAESPKKRKSK